MNHSEKKTHSSAAEGGKAPARRIAVIGAGASGCMAAIAAARSGCDVVLFEKNEKIGKKIYATGNGRCNLTNLVLDASCYRSGGGEEISRPVLQALDRFSREDLLRFFRQAGVPVHDRDGYVYPRTDQAETIALALEKQLRLSHVCIRTGCAVRSIDPLKGKSKTGFLVSSETEKDHSRTERFEAVILCTGGLAGPAFGCSGDGYRFAEALSHHIVKPLPSLTRLLCRQPLLKRAAGVRCHAAVTLLTKEREILVREEGEVQITEDSLSGIPVFQLSGIAARRLALHEKLFARVDFLPEFSPEAYAEESRRRLAESREQTLGSLFLGLVHKKVVNLLLACAGLQAEMKAKRLSDAELETLLQQLREFEVEVTGTGSFAQAQVTSGGIPLGEVDENFASRRAPGLYLTGELLDVDGRCGGYNLQWAMTSGWLAGRAAGESTSGRPNSGGKTVKARDAGGEK